MSTPETPMDLPLYLRVGNSPEHAVGTLDHPDALPELLRQVAAHHEAEHRSAPTPTEEN